MNKLNVLRIRIPESLIIPRLYLYSFLNLVEAAKKETSQYIVLKSDDVLETISEGLEITRELLEKRRNESIRRLSDIPMSGNDKKIFMKLCSELKCNLDSVEILEAYIDMLRSSRGKGVERFRKGLEEFNIGSRGYSLPSIFKLELYKLTRNTFFKDGFELKLRVSLDFLVLMLAGYLVSRVGQTRLDERTWSSVHVLPLELAWSKSSWLSLQETLSGRWYGIRPTDALILYLLIKLWDLLRGEPHNLMILGVIDPSGQTPASASVSINAPLREIYLRAGEALTYLLEKDWSRGALERLVRRALTIGQTSKEVAERLVKLIFLSIQGDLRSLEELSLTSSRLEARISAMKQLDNLGRETLMTAKDARRIAELLLNYYGTL